MEASCMQLSIEGERLLKAHDYEGAIEFFEAGLRVGTDDNEVLSAVFNQLGNACFYVGKFEKALEYHRKDLDIAEKLNDRQGMAKAFGNLGNTFKSLKNYPNAIKCCEAHLEITRELKDRLGEGRACYNLGNVYHALGKAKLAKREPTEQADGRKGIMTAIDYYKTSLDITTELKDTAGEGRAVGNLGNAYTAIGEFSEAIKYHQRRLKIANDANDLPAKARACGNLGNAHSALGEFSEAIRYYQQSLAVAKESNNIPGQGQAYYCLGTTYTMQKNYIKAVEYHEQHLAIATQVGDKQGQLRAWYNLRNAYHSLSDTPKTCYYHKLIQQAQPNAGQAPKTAGPAAQTLTTMSAQSAASSSNGSLDKAGKQKEKSKKKSNLKKGMVETFAVSDSDEDDDVVRTRKTAAEPEKPKQSLATDWLNDAVKIKVGDAAAPRESIAPSSAPQRGGMDEESSTLPANDFFEMLLMAQQTRLDDQRSPAPGSLQTPLSSTGGSTLHSSDFGSVDPGKEEDFFDMLLSVQSSRLDTQRSPAPRAQPLRSNAGPNASESAPAKTIDAPELDDNMSLFEMLALSKQQSMS